MQLIPSNVPTLSRPRSLALILMLVLAFCTPTSLVHAQSGETFDISIFGDMPYITGLPDPAPVLDSYRNLLEDIDRAPAAFIIHLGDYTNGPYCGDSIVQVRYAEFNAMSAPFVFIFGDNDWTDCGRGGFDPLERLAKLREVFTKGNESLGKNRMTLERQSAHAGYELYRENVRWTRGDVLFMGLNVVGSNNNWGPDSTPGAEYVARNAATLEWVRSSFAMAKERGMRGVAIFMQANPEFNRSMVPKEYLKYLTGFDELNETLRLETVSFGGPVAVIHGDSHYFRVDKPMSDPATGRVVTNFTRAESFGAQNHHWLRMTIDPSDPNLFRFTPMIVAKNAR